MVDSVFANSGRGCINCSGIWASRHTRDIAEAIAKRLADVRPLPANHPEATLAAFTVPGVASGDLGRDRRRLKAPGVTDVSATVPRRLTCGQGRPGRVPAADDRALHVPRCRHRSQGIHVPVRDGCRVSAGSDDRGDRSDARVQRDHQRPAISPATRRCRATSIA